MEGKGMKWMHIYIFIGHKVSAPFILGTLNAWRVKAMSREGPPICVNSEKWFKEPWLDKE